MINNVSQNISTNSIFHFVKKIDYLIDIIQNGFQARFCYEKIPFGQTPFAFPMKCFCDIPLGAIKVHLNRYGPYGIGVAKNFAKKEGITPVIYVHPNSITLINFTKEYNYNNNPNIINTLIPYFKNYEEKIIKGKRKIYIKYYDEREWRYIPRDGNALHLNSFSDKNEIKKFVEQKNHELKEYEYRLKIKPVSKITFIIVKDEKEIPLMIKAIKTNFKNEDIKDILISKIISSYRIKMDF